jgi:hypothetical protein
MVCFESRVLATRLGTCPGTEARHVVQVCYCIGSGARPLMHAGACASGVEHTQAFAFAFASHSHSLCIRIRTRVPGSDLCMMHDMTPAVDETLVLSCSDKTTHPTRHQVALPVPCSPPP